jgi:hypothetical protein
VLLVEYCVLIDVLKAWTPNMRKEKN